MIFLAKYKFKIIGIVIALLAIFFIYSYISSAFSERDALRIETKTQKDSITSLQIDIKAQKELNVSLVTRQKELVKIEKDFSEYKNKLQTEKQTQIQNLKKQIEQIKKEAPEQLDEYYIKRYNVILYCIEQITKGGEQTCENI